MVEVLVKGITLPDAYHKSLIELNSKGDVCDCADWNTTQKEISLTMVVESPLHEPRISKLFIGGPKELEQYRQEMLYGILDFEIGRGNWKYTYHDRMVHYPLYDTEWKYMDQIDFVINELKRNPSSRRAVILVRDPSVDAGSDDPACLQHIQYFIRNNKLECKVLFRSNDACKATFMNAFALICLQELIATKLEVEVGSYVHRASSFHCYEKDFDMLAGYCKRIMQAQDEYDVCFDYEDDWKEDMEGYQEAIAEFVKEQEAKIQVED